MKLIKVLHFGFFLSVLTISFFLTQKAISSTRSVDDVEPVRDDSITLNLPDQKYVISEKDLSELSGDLIIPTLDSTSPKLVYNKSLGVVESTASPKDYVISGNTLREQVSRYVSDDTRTINPTYILKDRYQKNLADFNDQLNQAHRTPLTISLKDGSKQSELTLDSNFLRQVIKPISTDIVHPLDLDKASLLAYLNSRLTAKQKKYFNPTVAYQNTKDALNSRFMGNMTPQVLGVDDGPSSRGELANKYLEVDLSQQKMYFFIGGSLYKEYRVSTGEEYPTPVGEFHILNKAPNAFSSIYNAWMPYWMGFKYAGDVKAYLGIHEIAYALDSKGKHIYRHGNYIGEMMTGGCVALQPGDSREVYNLSDVGMLVKIIK